MIKKSVSIFILACLFIGSSVFAQNAVKLEFKGMPQDVFRYEVTMEGTSSISAEGQTAENSMKVEMEIKQKVLKVAVDGTMDISTTITKGKSIVNNKEMPLPNVGATLLMKLTRRGQVLHVTGASDPAMNFKQMQIAFPEHPIRVGDSWTTKIDAGPQLPVPMEAKYTLVGFEKLNGYDCAKIRSVITVAPVNSGENMSLDVDANGVLYFAYKEGKMIKNVINTKMDMRLMAKGPGAKKAVPVQFKMDMIMVMGLIE